ncbi:MAG: hypothetical protein ABI685_02975 [Ferruginibacter sp.]
MKRLKKISLVYVLQVCAVVIIFAYPVKSSKDKPKQPAIDKRAAENIIAPAAVNKSWSGKTIEGTKFQVKFK